MKQIIRQSIFETNSSSIHSLVYSKKRRDHKYHLWVDTDGVLIIHFKEYGWSAPDDMDDLLLESNDKLDYIVTSLCWDLEDQLTEDIIKDQNKIYEFLCSHNKTVAKLFDLIKIKCSEVKDIQFALNEKYQWLGTDSALGWIDHQSSEEMTPYSAEQLVDIIFNTGAMIVIDNDNCGGGDTAGYYVFFDKKLSPGINHLVSPFGVPYDQYNITEKDFD